MTIRTHSPLAGRLRLLISLLAGLALLASACSSSATDTDGASNSDPTTETATDTATDETDTTDAPAETDGADDTEPVASSEPIKIGAQFALSGPVAQVGQAANDALNIWAEQVNSAGGINGQMVEIIVIDTQSDPTEAVAAARRFVDEEGVTAVMTAGGDEEVLATKDYYNDNETPVFAGTGCDCVYKDGVQPFIFKIPETQPVVLDVQMALAARDGITKLAWMGDSGPFGQAGLGTAQAMAEKHGVTIVAEETFGFGDTNMTPQATRVGDTDAEAVLVFSIPPAASIAQTNIRDLDLGIDVYHSYGSASQPFVDAAGGAAEGVVLVSPKVIVGDQLDDSDPQKAVIADYLAAGNPPVRFAVDLWDSVLILEEAITAVGSDRIAIQGYLENEVDGFVGAGGIRTFTAEDHTGLGVDSLIAARVVDNSFVLEATSADLFG